MNNHLHELEDQTQNYFRHEGFLDEQEELFIGMAINKLRGKSICFHGGSLKNIYELNVIESLCIPPFDTCWIEFESEIENSIKHPCGYLVDKFEGGYSAFMFIRDYSKKWKLSAVLSYRQGKASGKSEPNDPTIIATAIKPLNAFLSALNCTNIKTIEHKPSEKLQKSRKKRGKQPLFSTWTLELDMNRATEKGPHLGGTHASPRIHLRRGHPRQYAPGKYTWVQPCAVGNKSLGMIHKDYSVKTDK